ncbi:unnamed protein product, partial [Prorocentrum cordatum]
DPRSLLATATQSTRAHPSTGGPNPCNMALNFSNKQRMNVSICTDFTRVCGGISSPSASSSRSSSRSSSSSS